MRVPQLYSILILFTAMVFINCKKITVEKNTLPQGYSVAQIVGNWKVTNIYSDKPYDWDGNGSVETNIFGTWTDCDKDNFHEFKNDFTAGYKLSCNSTKAGTWQLQETNGLIIKVAGQPTGFETITKLTSNSFTTTSDMIVINNQVYKITKVWTRQP